MNEKVMYRDEYTAMRTIEATLIVVIDRHDMSGNRLFEPCNHESKEDKTYRYVDTDCPFCHGIGFIGAHSA